MWSIHVVWLAGALSTFSGSGIADDGTGFSLAPVPSSKGIGALPPRVPQWITKQSHAIVIYPGEKEAMSFSIYLLGYAFVIGGLAYGATLMHIPNQWIAVLVIVLVGVGILSGVAKTRMKDPS